MRVSGLVFAAMVTVLGSWSPTPAEEVEKRFRIGLAFGTFNARDEIRSDAGNVLNIVDEQDIILDRFIDPRQDSAITGNLEIKSDTLATLSGQYAINRFFLIEMSAGYQNADVGEVELQYQRTFGYGNLPFYSLSAVRIPVGEIERVPLQLTALARFRPTASFNPYLGGGIGYTLIGFDSSAEFDELSLRLDSSMGAQTMLVGEERGSQIFAAPPEEIGDLEGASVEAHDTFEWHVAAGAEYSFTSKWAAFVDFRYTFSSKSLAIGFNGGDDLGRPVPSSTVGPESSEANAVYGPVFFTQGGLIEDSGGLIDTGIYYLTGGHVDFGGFSAQAGIRKTF